LKRAGALALALGLGALASVAQADDGLRDLCPDRPGRGTSACTLDAGYFQLESDLVNGSFAHAEGVTTDTWLITNPNLKYGLTDDLDVEANIAPYEIVRTHDTKTDMTATEEGIGDLFLHLKYAAIGNGGSDFALVLEPFLKAPTAPKSIGNGAVEGGLVVPIAWALPDGWQLGSTPEIDINKNAGDDGRHVVFTDVVGLSHGVGAGVTLGVEAWESTDFDPAGATQQYSFDLNAAWIPDGMPNLQWDAGVNIGLNRNTAAAQLYMGVSKRFL
jgi:hypothetical protein